MNKIIFFLFLVQVAYGQDQVESNLDEKILSDWSNKPTTLPNTSIGSNCQTCLFPRDSIWFYEILCQNEEGIVISDQLYVFDNFLDVWQYVSLPNLNDDYYPIVRFVQDIVIENGKITVLIDQWNVKLGIVRTFSFELIHEFYFFLM